MRNLLLTLLLVFSFNTLKAQDEISSDSKSKIGITYSAFGNYSSHNSDENLLYIIAPPIYSEEGFSAFGLNYIYNFSKTIDLEVGINYSQFSFLLGQDSPQSIKINFISIPISLRINFLKYFFVNSGIELDYNLDNDYPSYNTGLGFLLGAGFNYEFNNGISLFANPTLKFHKTIVRPYSGGFFDMVFATSVRLGVMYSL